MERWRWKELSILCNLDKRHYTDDNTEITDQKLILQQHKLFYENLYESRDVPISDEHIKTFMKVEMYP